MHGGLSIHILDKTTECSLADLSLCARVYVSKLVFLNLPEQMAELILMGFSWESTSSCVINDSKGCFWHMIVDIGVMRMLGWWLGNPRLNSG